MRKIIWITLMFGALLASSCTDEYESDENLWSETNKTTLSDTITSRTTTPADTMPSTAEVNAEMAEEWDVLPEQVEMVTVLLNWALQVEGIYIDLLLENEELVNRIENPEHQWCLECKMKALKFCYYHYMWGDTVGCTDLGIELKESISAVDDFALWWGRIDWTK